MNLSSLKLCLRLAAVCVALSQCAAAARAQQGGSPAAPPQQPATAAAPVQVVPRPRQLERAGADFRLRRGARVVLADERSADDRFAAEDFMADVRETAGLSLRLGRGRGRGSILLGALDAPAVREALRRAGVSPPQDLKEEGYVLSVTADGVVVGGRDAAGTFYGMQTLKQLVRGEGEGAYVQGVRVVDWPAMRWRGLSDDISRGPVPTLEYVKRQIRNFAYLKLNMHSLYMEHVFGSASHPLVGRDGGSLAPEEIRELVAYARRHHVEVVPEQQTFGHLHKVLKLEKYAPLAEVPYGDMLSPQQEGSYELVADWYREVNELFPGRFFHIGADETFELGQGQSREAVRERGVGAVYFEHLRRVRELLRPYNRRLMFWGDIALNHRELVGSIPKDLIVMNWDYGRRESFTARIQFFKDAGLEQFVCPGLQNWSQVFPNTDLAAVNIPNFVRDGQRAGVLGMMNTNWDDDGETLFEMTWYGVALGAAASWQEAPLGVADFERDFDWAFFRSEGVHFTKAVRALGSANTLLGVNTTNQLFWQEPFTDAFQERARTLSEKVREMRLRAEGAEESLMREGARARRNRPMLSSMAFAARRIDHMGRRFQLMEQLSRDYWDAYLNLGDRRRVMRLRTYQSPIYDYLREMAEELSLLRDEYRAQWLAENRPYWLSSVLARYDLAVGNWLARSKALSEALREYDETSTLPSPAEFGLGPRPEPAAPAAR